MGKDIEEIKELLQSGEYQNVLEKIERSFSEGFDLNDKSDEKKYLELLKLRVTAKTLAGQDDQIILDAVWKEKYPSGNTYTLDNGHKIHLLYKSSFDFKSDAYVNTIHSVNLFDDAHDRSATMAILKRTGAEEAKRQVNPNKKLSKGDFVILKHPDLSAPMSYHILFYENDVKDLDKLARGIQSVLNDSIFRKQKKISFFPIGFDLVVRAEDRDKNQLADELANKIAETIIYFINENRSKDLPEIYFNFVTVQTMMCFDRVFYRWSKITQDQLRSLQRLSAKEKLFIDEVATKDENYIKSLKEIYYAFDDTSPILILGETGSGKSYLAELIHKNSSRASKKIVKLNCALIKAGTITQYLFGWKKGSYSDAKADGKGAIEVAEGSTLFLDEIGYVEPEVQRMLLNFLQDGNYSRFGEQEVVRTADVRLLFGTNVNIEENINAGLFQGDLYERISKYEITLSALRERPGDIVILVDKIINNLNSENEFRLEISEGAKELFKTYSWPGNIRQLQFYLEKLFNYCRYNKISYVTDEHIKKDPPRDTLFRTINPYVQLESILSRILNNSKRDHSNIVQEVIEPMLAKIYIEDIKGIIKESSKYIGMDGTRGEKSTLSQRYEQYKKIKAELFK